MMKLRILQAVVATLNDTNESPIADQLLSAWEHDAGSARYFRGSANNVFLFTTRGQPQVLRFTHASERTMDALVSEGAYLDYLSNQGIPVAPPICSLAGRYVESAQTSLGLFHAVVFPFIAGEQFDIDELSLEQFATWGRALGTLHQAAQGYVTTGRPTIHDHLAMVQNQLPSDESTAQKVLAAVQRQIASLPVDVHRYGLIHYDFELDNVIWGDTGLGIVDFDDSAWYWYAADIAFALRDLCDDTPEKIDLHDESVAAFITGYRSTRSLADEELELMPLFLRAHNLVSFAKILRAIDNGDHVEQPDEPTWVAQLRTKLLHKAQRYRDTFAAYAATNEACAD